MPNGSDDTGRTSSSPTTQHRRGSLRLCFGPGPHRDLSSALATLAMTMQDEGTRIRLGFLVGDTTVGTDTTPLSDRIPFIEPLKPVNGIKTFDLDKALTYTEDTIVVENAGQANPPGSRNAWRYQDIDELLNAGIDVLGSVAVTDLETPLLHHEEKGESWSKAGHVPESFLDQADHVYFVDAAFPTESDSTVREAALARMAIYIQHRAEASPRKPMGGQFLVCVGPAPSSAHCISWTSRMARAFHMPWTALYVRTEHSMEGEQASLDNLDYARRMGAHCIIVSSDDKVQAVSEYARKLGVTDIVLGKSRTRKSFFRRLEMDFEDALLSQLPEVDLHILPNRNISGTYIRHKNSPIRAQQELFSFSWRDSLLTAGIFTLTSLLLLGIRNLGITTPHASSVYMLCVLLVARYTSGYAYGLAATLLSILGTAYFFTAPYFSLSILQEGFPLTFTIMTIVALVTSTVTLRHKQQNLDSVQREWQAQTLSELTRMLADAHSLEEVSIAALHHLSKIFHCEVRMYAPFLTSPLHEVPGTMGKQEHLPCPQGEEIAAWVLKNAMEAGHGTDTYQDSSWFFLPVKVQETTYATLALSRHLNAGEHQFLEIIVRQIALACERQVLEETQQQSRLAAEREKLRSNLLRSISHDLRTPLTGIYGAASALWENPGKLPEETKKSLARNIMEDSAWLIRMVENLLSVTRIQAENAELSTVEEAAEEIISSAASRVRHSYPGREIRLSVPQDLLMVPMDSTLISQVLINLMENALEYSPIDSPVTVRLYAETGTHESRAVFEVQDEGPGIPEELLPTLFDTAPIAPMQPPPTANTPASSGAGRPDARRGMGIGLSLCFSIVTAHHGTMEARQVLTGGMLFRFSLPLAPTTRKESP